jgi:hypothetical protein
MARFLEQHRDADAIAADAAKVRATVEGVLADIAARGGKANVRMRRSGRRNVTYAQAAE